MIQFLQEYAPAILLSAFLISASPALAQDKIELKNAKELTGRTVDGQSIREAKGDVEFVQGNVRVFCNSAVQYMGSNKVELSGNVKILQDTLTLLTERAVYFGDEKRAVCSGGVTLKDPNATLRSNDGVYTFNDAKAYFKGNVIIVNPKYRITSEELIYFRNSEESFATGNVIVTTDSGKIKAQKIDFFSRAGRTFARDNVVIETDSTFIYADTATEYSNERRSVASGNVMVNSLNNNTKIYGSRLENFEREMFTIVSGNAFLIKTGAEEDTLLIYCDTMLAVRVEPETYTALGNVEVIRGEFASRSGKAEYFKSSEIVSLSREPVVWQGRIQLTADSVYAELPGNKLQKIYASRIDGIQGSKISFAISENLSLNLSGRYDQISGREIAVTFSSDKVSEISVSGNSKCIYFMYEEDLPNGMNKIEGNKIDISFDSSEKISKIKVTEDPKGEYVPEQMVGRSEQFLPGFNYSENRPVKKTAQ